jgi:DNA repair protein RadC
MIFSKHKSYKSGDIEKMKSDLIKVENDGNQIMSKNDGGTVQNLKRIENRDPCTSIKDWPTESLPMERLLRQGPENLTDEELLSIILRTGGKKGSYTVVDLSREILRETGGLRNLEYFSINEIEKFRGIGKVKASQLKAVFEIAKRINSYPVNRGFRISSSADVAKYFKPYLETLKHEVFKIVMLDRRNRFIREMTISQGSLTASIVHPREVFKPAVRESAASLIFIHNHPSGDPTPSKEDILLTRQLKEAGKIFCIDVLDHIILGDGIYFSMSNENLL